jgi:hypothetical protein
MDLLQSAVEMIFSALCLLTLGGFYLWVLYGRLISKMLTPMDSPQGRSYKEPEGPIDDDALALVNVEELNQEIGALEARVRELESTGGSGTTVAKLALTRNRERLAKLRHRRAILMDVDRPWSPQELPSAEAQTHPGAIQATERLGTSKGDVK